MTSRSRFLREQRKQDAEAEVETVHHDIDEHRKRDDEGPDDRKVDGHHRDGSLGCRTGGGRDAGGAGRDLAARPLFARMRRLRHQAQQVDHAGREHHEIDDDERDQRGGDRGRRQRRGGFSRPQQSIDRERLASGLGGDPAREHRDEARRPHRDRKHMQQPGIVQRAAPAHQQAEQAEPHHQQSHADHDPERPERDRHRRPVFARHGVEAGHRRVERMLEDQRAQFRHFDRIVHPAGGLVGQAEQDQRRAVLVALVMAFHRHDLHRLMLQRVEPVLVAGENLDRRHQRRHPHRHREHHARAGQMPVAQQMPGADRADHQRGGQIRRQHHVHEAVGE